MKHKISIIVAVVLGGFLLVGPFSGPEKLLWLTLLIICWTIAAAYGSYRIGLDWYLKSVHRVEANAIALTFDDGPDPDTTPRILSILNDAGVTATFFLIGEKAEKYPDLVRQIAREGHGIGNHSFSHRKDIGFFGTDRLREDIGKANRVLELNLGRPVPLFRPPFGVTNPRYAKVLTALGLRSIGWSLRSYDTVIKNEEKLAARLRNKVRGSHIVLLHDSVPATVSVLAPFIVYCKSRQLDFVKLPLS